MTEKQMPTTKCKACGETVIKATTVEGKKYLAFTHNIHNEDGRLIKTLLLGHKCDPREIATYGDRQERTQEWEARAKGWGMLVNGQQVEVIAGRKVPKGTRGEVFWIATNMDDYDVWKIGFATEAGEKHFINVDNVVVIKEGTRGGFIVDKFDETVKLVDTEIFDDVAQARAKAKNYMRSHSDQRLATIYKEVA